MAKLVPVPGVPLETSENFATVEPSTSAPLPAGTYVFSLVVVDDAGIASDPHEVKIEVRDKPKAVLVPSAEVVAAGQAFRLSAERSTPKDKIKNYIYTLKKPQ